MEQEAADREMVNKQYDEPQRPWIDDSALSGEDQLLSARAKPPFMPPGRRSQLADGQLYTNVSVV